MDTYFYLFFAFLFLMYNIIFIVMTKKNEDEWKFTLWQHSLLIGAIVGIIPGIAIGYLLFNMAGLYLGASAGIILGALSCLLNKLLLDFRLRPKKKEVKKKVTDDKDDILKQLKDLEKRLKK